MTKQKRKGGVALEYLLMVVLVTIIISATVASLGLFLNTDFLNARSRVQQLVSP